MRPIHYTGHLKLRLRIRKIPYEYPSEIYHKAEQRFYDVIEKKNIALKELHYNKKIRNMMIAYEEKNESIEIVTIHPIAEERVINRILSGRWVQP